MYSTTTFLWMSTTVLLVLVSLLEVAVVEADVVDTFTWVESSTSLPKPVSDITATYMKGKDGSDTSGFIVIFGGCDSALGNQRNKSKSLLEFFCTSVTNSTYMYNPYQNTVTQMADAPHPRYRHVAVVAATNDEIFMLGGRDLADNLVTAIDAFNPYNNTWTTRGYLPEDIVTSDAAGWSTNQYIYYAGGYDSNYTAQPKTFRLDVSNNPTNFTSMAYTPLSSMKVRRGDFSAEAAFGYAYIVGGTSDATEYCVSMTDVERYDIASDTWEVMEPLNYGVDDSAVAFLRGKIVTVGGETKRWNCLTVGDPALGSDPDNVVEAIDASLNATETSSNPWKVYSDFPFNLMRFDAVAVPAQGRIYTFGGQRPFDEGCQCFAAVDSILYGTESFASTMPTQGSSSNSKLSPGAIAGISIAVIVGVGIIGGFIFWRYARRDKEFSSSD